MECGLVNLRSLQNLYKVFGDFLKTKCAGTSAFIYTGNPELRKFIGLKTTKRIPLDNGKLEGLLLQIDSYKGSKKKNINKLSIKMFELLRKHIEKEHNFRMKNLK